MSKVDSNKYVSMSKEEWLKPENLLKIEEWAKDGLIIQNVANNMGIATSTFYIWKKEMPEIEQAWLRGKLHADTIVLNSAFRSATGYMVEETVKEYDENGNLIGERITNKHIPSNANILDKWLKNRLGDAFKDNQLTETYRKKVEAETRNIELKNALLEGVTKDTSMLDSLQKLFKAVEGYE